MVLGKLGVKHRPLYWDFHQILNTTSNGPKYMYTPQQTMVSGGVYGEGMIGINLPAGWLNIWAA